MRSLNTLCLKEEGSETNTIAATQQVLGAIGLLLTRNLQIGRRDIGFTALRRTESTFHEAQ